MTAVDFANWVKPDLELPWRGRTFAVRPPSVADARMVMALALRFEVGADAMPSEINELLEGLPEDGHPALGSTYAELVEAGVDPWTLGRMGVYATLFWARSREYADVVAVQLWGENSAARTSDKTREGSDARPKGSRSGPPKTGRSMASAIPSATTKTASQSSGTTGRSRAKPST